LPASPWFSYATINGVRIADDADPVVEHELRGVLTAAEAAGFPGISIDLSSIDSRIRDGGTAASVAADLAAHGLRCGDISALRLTDAGDDDAQLARISPIADAMQPAFCVTTIDVDPGPDVVRRLGHCADALAELGVRLAIEALPYCRVSQVDQAIGLCGAVGWERARLTIDTWHVLHGSGTVEGLATIAPDQIALLQLSDPSPDAPADLASASRHARAMPGPLSTPIARALRSSGFDGIVAVEVLSAAWRAAGPSALTHAAIESARTVWLDAAIATPT
jgi:sugar phosphate isomerase/epimerase